MVFSFFLFLDWTPVNPEPVYIATGLEMEPLYPDSKENTVVYLAEDGRCILKSAALKHNLKRKLISYLHFFYYLWWKLQILGRHSRNSIYL